MLLPREARIGNMNSSTVYDTVTYTSTWAQNQASPACVKGALFFRHNSEFVLVCAPLILALTSFFTTQWLRHFTPKSYKASFPTEEPQPGPATNGNECTSTPEAAAEGEADEPPPYDPRVASEPEMSAPDKPETKSSSAELFVKGSALFFTNVAALVFGALSVQALVHCGPWSPMHPLLQFIWWFIYSLLAGYASLGFMCWLMLLRNLWGRRMAKKYPIYEDGLIMTLVSVVISPVMILGYSSICVIEMLQKRCCGDALEEDEELAVELEDTRATYGDHQAEGSGAGVEERVGLMQAMEK